MNGTVRGVSRPANASDCIEINFTLGGDYSSTSYHYRGKAVDLHAVGSFSKLKAALTCLGTKRRPCKPLHCRISQNTLPQRSRWRLRSPSW